MSNMKKAFLISTFFALAMLMLGFVLAENHGYYDKKPARSTEEQREAQAEERLLSDCFTDAPTVSEARGIEPSLSEREEDITDACAEAGIEEPILPPRKVPDARLFQRTAYLTVDDTVQCRCTYFVYASESKVYSLWIEASLVEDGEQKPDTLSVFSARTSQDEILQKMTDDG